ncbi:MAG TPA: HAD family hydrolase [Methylomirabilota bacterium]|nr:HAD family hydrolase [Methylomirabilota bacterium]
MPRDPAVFIDRDGTLNEEVGYLNHPQRLRLIPGAAEAVRTLNNSLFKVIVATNQSGIAKGYVSEALLGAIHEELIRQLKAEGAYLDGIYVCAHHPTEGESPYRALCDCRKPSPGLLLKAAADLDLDLSRSFVVGDKISDIELARRVNAKGVLVLTGYGLGERDFRRHLWPAAPDHIAEDLLHAVAWILGQ